MMDVSNETNPGKMHQQKCIATQGSGSRSGRNLSFVTPCAVRAADDIKKNDECCPNTQVQQIRKSIETKRITISHIDMKLATYDSNLINRLCLVRLPPAFKNDAATSTPENVVKERLWPALKFNSYFDLMRSSPRYLKVKFTMQASKLALKAGTTKNEVGFAYVIGESADDSLILLETNGKGELVMDENLFDFYGDYYTPPLYGNVSEQLQLAHDVTSDKVQLAYEDKLQLAYEVTWMLMEMILNAEPDDADGSKVTILSSPKKQIGMYKTTEVRTPHAKTTFENEDEMLETFRNMPGIERIEMGGICNRIERGLQTPSAESTDSYSRFSQGGRDDETINSIMTPPANKAAALALVQSATKASPSSIKSLLFENETPVQSPKKKKAKNIRMVTKSSPFEAQPSSITSPKTSNDVSLGITTQYMLDQPVDQKHVCSVCDELLSSAMQLNCCLCCCCFECLPQVGTKCPIKCCARDFNLESLICRVDIDTEIMELKMKCPNNCGWYGLWTDCSVHLNYYCYGGKVLASDVKHLNKQDVSQICTHLEQKAKTLAVKEAFHIRKHQASSSFRAQCEAILSKATDCKVESVVENLLQDADKKRKEYEEFAKADHVVQIKARKYEEMTNTVTTKDFGGGVHQTFDFASWIDIMKWISTYTSVLFGDVVTTLNCCDIGAGVNIPSIAGTVVNAKMHWIGIEIDPNRMRLGAEVLLMFAREWKQLSERSLHIGYLWGDCVDPLNLRG